MTAMRLDLDFIQLLVIKLGGLIVVGLIVLIHVVKLARAAIEEIKNLPTTTRKE